MCSPLKLLICVGLICATAVSANKKTKRDVRDLLVLPHQWQLQNNDLGLRTFLSRVSTPDFKILRIDSYGQDMNGRQLEDSLQSIGGNSPQQSSVRESINPTPVSAENSEEQYTNEKNELQQENGNALSSSTGGQWSSGRSNGQSQSQISGGLRNSLILRGNSGRTSIGSNQIPLWRSYSSNNNQQRESGSRNGAIIVPLDDQRLEQQRRGQVWTPKLELNNDETNARLLGEQRLGKISRGNILQENFKLESQNSQGVESDIQRDIPSGFASENSRFGSQIGRDSNDQYQGIQEELRGDNIGRQQLNQVGWNRQRLPSTRNWNRNNIGSRQEGVDQRNKEGRITSGNISNDNQLQINRDQNNISEQLPNTYTYGELSAKILKVIQSNPSMLSNMNALMEELGNDGESRNQQVKQLKSLLQKIGQLGENASSVGDNGRGQQNPLIRNLLEIMEGSINNQKRSNIPTY